ncbi:hypothetical protein PN498_01745 [Oscillatoria sp. CS-180]|nr:hypothetical protein [Oscillatoria sp. CS-180]MDB9524698.1 hypothetical protein [Oscillatoria sp. CS-180]
MPQTPTVRGTVDTPQAANPNLADQGMYPYKDTQRDTTVADAKADRSIKQAERRRRQKLQTGGYVDDVAPAKSIREQAKDIGRSAERAAENVGDSTQRAADNAVQNTKKGLQNLREGASDAAERAADTIDPAT